MFEIELKYVERGMPIILTVRSGAGQAAELVRFLPTEPGTHTFTSDEVAAALSPTPEPVETESVDTEPDSEVTDGAA